MLLNEVVAQPEVIVLVGLPGSGKSTYVNKVNKNGSYVVVSTDDIMTKTATKDNITYDQVFKSYPYKEFEREMFADLKAALSKKRNVIVDQTNMTIKSRRKKLAMIPAGYKKIAVVFSVDDTELKRRVDARGKAEGKTIPANVMSSMKASYQAPTKEEGFDEIINM